MAGSSPAMTNNVIARREAPKQSSVSPRHVAHFRLRTCGARLDCFVASLLAMTKERVHGA
jgi:hypothetical protein